MREKIVSILICIMMIMTAFVVFKEITNVKAGPGDEDEGNIGLDYDFIYEVIKKLSEIIFDDEVAKDHGIWKGRNFGTEGERYARNLVYDYMNNNINNLEANVFFEQIGNESYGDDKDILRLVNNKMEITDYGLQFKEGTSEDPDVIIHQNETFPFSVWTDNVVYENFSTGECYELEWDRVKLIRDLAPGIIKLGSSPEDVTKYDVSQTLFNSSQYVAFGELTYIEDYPNASTEEKEEKLHLINVTDSEFNETIEMLENSNASGFVLIRNDFSTMEEWQTNLSGFVISEENGSMVINLTQNGTLFCSSQEAGMITDSGVVYFIHQSDTFPICDKKMYVINASLVEENWIPFLIRNFIAVENLVAGFIIYDDINPQTHFQYPAASLVGINKERSSFSRLKLPTFAINGSVVLNGEMEDFGDWIDEKEVYANFWLNETKNYEVKSHNVICDVYTEDSDEWMIFSGGHHEGWWGQMTIDDAAGIGMMLGILKYLNDNEITPRCNLRFISHGGHECGLRGSLSHVFNESNWQVLENASLIINIDQIGHHFQHASFRINTTNYDCIPTLWTITEDSNYNETYQDKYYWVKIGKEHANGTMDAKIYNFDYRKDSYSPLRQGFLGDYLEYIDLDYINFCKDSFPMYHRTGNDHTIGDTLDVVDHEDVNATVDIIWNVIKYYMFDPDCWFEDVSFEAIDSLNDGDTLDDSIIANFTIKSVLPHDSVRVVANITQYVGEEYINYSMYKEYIVTPSSSEESWVIQIPDLINHGNCSVQLNLFNSTGRIDYITTLGDTVNYNDTSNTSDLFHLYHPFGYTKTGASHQSTNDRITGSVFTANENGIADSIAAYVYAPTCYPPKKSKCMIYRSDDSTWVGTTEELEFGMAYGGEKWMTYNFSDPKPTLDEDTEYFLFLWSNGTSLYYNDFSYERGRHLNKTYNSTYWQYPVPWVNESRLYSLYCSYTADTTPPEINNVSDIPDTVGFGFNVTINADVTDNESGVDVVKVNITYPDSSNGNFTMNNTINDTYEYIFSDTWHTGQYNYTIWAIDNCSNSNSRSGYSFNISANATINVATLNDTYGSGEYINITDPPTPPEDYYLTDRGLTYNKYYNAVSGNDVLEVYTKPVNYQDENEEWTPINATIETLDSDHPAYSYGYRAGNQKGLYSTYFKPNIQSDWPVAFAYDKSDNPTTHVVRSKLVGVGYLDPSSDWDYEYLQNAQSSTGQLDGNSVTYEDVFTGTDVMWSYSSSGLKEDIIMGTDAETMLSNNPPSDYGLSNSESYLVFITKLDYQGLTMYDESGDLTGNVTITENGVDFKDALGDFKCALPIGVAYEQNNPIESTELTYRIIQYNGNYYLLSGLKVIDLNDMTFPVVVDPTLTTYSSSSDGYIMKSNSDYNTAWNSSTGTVVDTYSYFYIGQREPLLGFPPPKQIFRGFVFFNTSSIPSNMAITSATLSLYKYGDYSTTDFDITVQNGQPTYPHDPLVSGDYDKDHYSGDGGSMNTSGFSNGYNDISLTNYSWINEDSWTKLCLRSSRDINAIAPTNNEYVTIRSNEYPLMNSPKLVIEYRNQSKIKNTGSTNISGYLFMQVEYYDNESEPSEWVLDTVVINETTPRTINIGEQLALDLIFNGEINTDDLVNGDGQYRIYAAFRDEYGDVLICDDESVLEAWYEFTVDTS